MTDLTGQRETERKLEETKAFLDNIICSTPDSIIVLDYDGQVKSANPAVIHLLGYEGEEDLLGRPIDLVVEKELLPQSVSNAEARFRRRDGSFVPTYLSCAEMRDDQKRLLGFVVIARDITELKKTEKLKDEFVATVSHEFRTPLTIIQQAITNLQMGIAHHRPAKQREILDMMERNVARLAHLITNILDLSRLESASEAVAREPLNLGKFLKGFLKDFSFKARHQGLNLSLDLLPSPFPEIYADPGLLEEVLANLLENGLHFAKTRLNLRVRYIDRSDESPIAAVQFCVKDDGPGIPAQDQQGLFSRFHQLRRPQGGAGYKGTGLGLAICRAVVEKQGGRIWVKSIEGEGASFHFTLPAGLPARAGQDQFSPPEAAPHGKA